MARAADLLDELKASPPAIKSMIMRIVMPVRAVGRRPALSTTNGPAMVPANTQQDAMTVRVNGSATPSSTRKTVAYVVDRMIPEI